MTQIKTVEEIVEELKKQFWDKGDERYGWVKHSNTIVQRQIDWLRTTLAQIRADHERELTKTAFRVREEEATEYNKIIDKLEADHARELDEVRRAERERIINVIRRLGTFNMANKAGVVKMLYPSEIIKALNPPDTPCPDCDIYSSCSRHAPEELLSDKRDEDYHREQSEGRY